MDIRSQSGFDQLIRDLENVADEELRCSLITQAQELQQTSDAEREANEWYRLEKEWQEKGLSLLSKARNAVSRQLDLKEIIQAVVEGIAETFGYTLVSLYLIEENELVLQHQIGYESVVERFPIEFGIAGRTARTGQPILVKDVRTDDAFFGIKEDIVSEICVPLLDNMRVVGVLDVESIAGEELTERDLNLIIGISQHVSVAIQRTHLYSALRENTERYQSVLESVGEVVYQTSLDGKLVFLNPAWTKITGYSVEESLGKEVSFFNYRDDAVMALRQRQLLLENEQDHLLYQVRLNTKNGGVHWVQVNAHPLYNSQGELIGTTGTLTDINDRKFAEERAADQRLFADTLREVASSLINIFDLNEMLDQVVVFIARVVRYNGLCVGMIERNHIRPVRGYGYAENDGSNWQDVFPMHIDLFSAYESVVRGGNCVILDELGDHPDLMRAETFRWVKSRLYVPIRAYGEVIGIICLDSKFDNAFSERDAMRVLAISDQSGMAIRNAEIYSALSKRTAILQERVAQRTAELKRTHVQIEALLTASSDSIIVVNESGSITQCNPAFCLLLGCDAQDVIGQSLISFIDPESTENLAKALEAVFTDKQRQRVEITAVDSSRRTVEVDVALDPIAEQDLVVCSLRDNSGRLRIERGLRMALEHERKLVELKSQFGVTVSHEFRTPLAVILSSTEMLERYFPQLTSERRRELFDNVRHQIDYMTDVIDNILVVSKADTIGLPVAMQHINLLEFCLTIVQEMQWLAGANHQILFHHEGDLSSAFMDPYFIRRILVNILSNAIKYSPDGGKIEFDILSDGFLVKMSIRDQGIGIPEADLENLFDTFQRAGNVGSIPGTGIGLAIVKRAVDLHAGTIEVRSSLQIGTTFYIELPLLPIMPSM